MGKFIWHQWAQYVLIFASVYTVWASFWGMFFRKFFWDFVNGTNMPGPNHINGRPCFDDNPCGIVPARQDQIFINLIVNQPIVQILAMIFGVAHLVIECVPAVSKMSIYRSFPLKIVTLAIQAFLTCLFYQGTNGAIYSTTAMIGYIVATIKGEEMEVAKDNRGKGGRA